MPFALGQFCLGPDAKCLNQLLLASQILQDQQLGRGGSLRSAGASRQGLESGLGGVLPQTLNRGTNERVTVVHVDRPLHVKVTIMLEIISIPTRLIYPIPMHDQVSKADLLSPLASCLVALWRADEAADEDEDEDEEISPVGEMDLDPPPEKGEPPQKEGEEGEGDRGGEDDQWLDRQPFIESLGSVADERVLSDLDYLTGFLDWPKSDGEGGARGGVCGLPPLDAFRALREALGRVRGQTAHIPPSSSHIDQEGMKAGPFSHPLDINLTLGSPGGGGGGGGGGGEGLPSNHPSPSPGGDKGSPKPFPHSPMATEPPDEFLDPITAAIMMDPVILPDSQVTVDRTTIERQISIQGTDPFR